MKKFSIIIPAHNNAKYLLRCLNSIYQQTYKNFEIIFVNDDSFDQTEKIIHNYYNFSNFKYYVVNFHDVSSVRNYAISKASGDIIVFVDSDDWLEKQLLENINLNNHEEGIIRYQAVMKNDNGNIVENFITSSFKNLRGIDALNKFISNYEIYSPIWLYAIDMDFWNKHNFKFTEGKLQEDFGLTSLILSKANNISSIPYIGYNYYKSVNSIMRNFNYSSKIKKAYDVLYHYDILYNEIAALQSDQEFKYNLVNYFIAVLEGKLNQLNDEDKNKYAKELDLRKNKWRW